MVRGDNGTVELGGESYGGITNATQPAAPQMLREYERERARKRTRTRLLSPEVALTS